MTRFIRTTLAVAALLSSVAVSDAMAKGPKAPVPSHFQTGGYGVFSPANLGVGDPATHPFPAIIGDGSGLSAYNGTPTGNEFKLDGVLVGDGWDRHFGAAQTFGRGVAAGPGVFLYFYETASNPIRPGRKIHIMNTREGEVWFEYSGFFTLDLSEGSLVSRSMFRITGGTRKFAGASGDVFVTTRTVVANITAAGAPFRYDFDGQILLCH